MISVFRIFRVLGEERLEKVPANPLRHDRVSGTCAEQTISHLDGLVGAESQPIAQFRNKGRIVHLGTVPFDDKLRNRFALCQLGEYEDRDPVLLRGRLQQVDVVRRDLLPVID